MSELYELLEKYYDGALSPQEQESLQELLEDPENARVFAKSCHDYATVEALLNAKENRERTLDFLEGALFSDKQRPKKSSKRKVKAKRKKRPLLTLTLLAAAAALLLILRPAWERFSVPVEAHFQAKLQEGSLPDKLESGRQYSMRSGAVEFFMPSGSRVVIESPAQFSLKGKNHLELKKGRLFSQVPEGAEGFIV